MLHRWFIAFALIAAPARAEGPSPTVYDRAVYLVTQVYMGLDDVTPQDLLAHAADELADKLDWLVVERTADGVVHLSHGLKGPIGAVSVTTWGDLPGRMAALESIIRNAGYPLHDADLPNTILTGASKALDRYSRVLAGEKLEDFDTQLSGTLVGIGATLGSDESRLTVRELTHGGPAEGGGLRVGDVIERIDGVSTVNMPVSEASRRVRGAVDTTVALDVLRESRAVNGPGRTERLSIKLTRANIVVSNVTSAVLPGDVAYLAIDHVSQKTVYNLRRAMADLSAIGALSRGIVLDLRGNTGGSMKESAGVVDQFVKSGLLLLTVGRHGAPVENLTSRIDAHDGDDEPNVPLVVLVDERTASGAEIISGGLLEHARAVLVGQRTFGKGQVQKIYDLDPSQRFKITVAEYVLANDRHVIGNGIIPDVTVGDISLGAHGARYGAGWNLDRESVAWDDVLPNVHEGTDWRDRQSPEVDLAKELARRAVLSAKDGTREQTLIALRAAAADLRADQLAHLTDAYAAHDIDWSPADAPGPVPEATATVDVSPDPTDANRRIVHVSVTNQGKSALRRTLVRLTCPTFLPWDDLVVPIGLMGPGATGEGSVKIELGPGLRPREDLVGIELRADGRPALALPEQAVTAASAPTPRLVARARLTGTGTERSAHVTVRNLDDVGLNLVEASFVWTDNASIELIDRARSVPTIAPRAEASFDLGVRVLGMAPPALPLELRLDAAGYNTVLDWDMPVPTNGQDVVLQAPHIDTSAHATSAPVGAYTLPVTITDDRDVTSVVVIANGHKVLYDPGGVANMALRAPMRLDTGSNRILVRAVDDQGLVSEAYLTVLGLGGEGVSAGE